MNTVSGRIVLTTWAGSVIVPRRDVTVTRSPSATPSGSASCGCISHSGSGYWATSAGDAPGLGARQVLADDPAGGQPDRVLVVDDLGRLAVRHGVEAGLAVGVEELPALVQAGRAGVADLGDRPEQAHLVLDALPGGAACSRRCRRRWRGSSSSKICSVFVYGKYSPLPSRSAMSSRISQSRRASPGGVDGGVDLDDAALAAGRGALVLLVQRAGQHDVGVLGGLGQEEVDDGVELELVERLAR